MSMVGWLDSWLVGQSLWLAFNITALPTHSLTWVANYSALLNVMSCDMVRGVLKCVSDVVCIYSLYLKFISSMKALNLWHLEKKTELIYCYDLFTFSIYQ